MAGGQSTTGVSPYVPGTTGYAITYAQLTGNDLQVCPPVKRNDTAATF